MSLSKKFGIILALGLMMTMHTAASAANMTISSATDFVNFAAQVNAGDSFAGSTVTLAGNIDLSATAWVPAGTKQTPFAGTFEGGYHTISGAKNSLSADRIYAGIFGYNTGTIRNLTVSAAVWNEGGWYDGIGHWTNASHNYTAVLVGYNEGNIDNCKAQGYTTIDNQRSYSVNGGIAGYNKGAINNCTSEVNINAYTQLPEWPGWNTIAMDCYAGGIAGINEGTVTNCTNTGEIKSRADYASATSGGIVGDNKAGGTVTGCNNTGRVYALIKFPIYMGHAYAGGVAGTNGGTVTASTAKSAEVRAEAADTTSGKYSFVDIGGICGYNFGTIDNCQTEAQKLSGGIITQWTSDGVTYTNTEWRSAYLGGIVGYNRGTVNNVTATHGTSSSPTYTDSTSYSPDYLGGICGYNEDGRISRAVSDGYFATAYGDAGRVRYIGGIAGMNDKGYIGLSGVTTKHTASTSGKMTSGGVAGKNAGTIENSYYSGASFAAKTVGGIAGENQGSIINCYAVGLKASGTTTMDGIAAINEGYVSGCYCQGTTTCQGATKVTSTSALKKPETFVNWDFDAVWEITSTYPSIKASLGEFSFFGEGNGTASSPYMITTPAELSRVRYQPDKHYRLMNDIDMTGYNWAPIGNGPAGAFTGTFEGNGHTISNLTLTSTGNEYNGFFGYIDGAGIYNLNIVNASYTLNETHARGASVGGICAFARNNATIENCVFNGTITATSQVVSAGGIAGDFEGTVKGCHTLGTITVTSGGDYTNSIVGGICGKAEGTVTGSNSKMAIVARTTDPYGYPMEATGGIVGRMRGDIVDSCFEGTVNITNSDTVYHGGITGSVEGNVKNSYTDYQMTGASDMKGAVAGQVMQGDVTTSYYDSSSSSSIGYGQGVTSFALNTLRQNATEKKYIWVTAKDDNDPEPLHVAIEWIIDENGFTRCKLTPNTENTTIYYTTNGTTPTSSSTVYQGPFLVDLMDKINYYVVSGDKTSEVMGFVSAPQSKYQVQITSVPTNQSGEKITTANVASATKVNVTLLTEEDTVGTRVFLVVLDNSGKIIYANSTIKTLKKGETPVEFNNLTIPSGGSKIQIYVWDNEMKLKPRSEVIKL